MRRLPVPLILLAMVFVFPARAQQKNPPVLRPASSTQPASPEPEMTPRQMQELRGDIYMARKMYPNAIATYKKLLRQEKKNPVLLNKIGVAFQQWERPGPAAHFYKKAIKADKTYASAYNNLGTIEYGKKHYSKAIRWYEKTLKLRMEAPATVYSNLGYAYFGEKHFPEAMEAFEKAIVLDPGVFQRRGESGSVVSERTMTDPGLFYFYIARTFALAGDADRAAHFLKMARDDGYQGFAAAKTDPAFARVIKDPRVREVFAPVPALAQTPR